MSQKTIEVVVSPRGEAAVLTRGYAGADCLAASRFLEDSLGAVADEKKTAEFFNSEQAEQRVRQ